MLKNLLVLLIGALLGANIVYFVMTRGARAPAAAPAIAEAPADVAAPPASRSGPTTAEPLPQAPAGTSASVATPASTQISAPAPPAGRLLIPVSGVRAAALSDTFDDARGNERSHQALDIMAPAGTPVLAVAAGSIEKLFESKQGGLTVYQFEPSGRYAYYYAHLQAYAPGLAEKKSVRQGDLIGYVGSTGNANPAAPHLHFAIFALGPERQWWKGTPINPYPLLTAQ